MQLQIRTGDNTIFPTGLLSQYPCSFKLWLSSSARCQWETLLLNCSEALSTSRWMDSLLRMSTTGGHTNVTFGLDLEHTIDDQSINDRTRPLLEITVRILPEGTRTQPYNPLLVLLSRQKCSVVAKKTRILPVFFSSDFMLVESKTGTGTISPTLGFRIVTLLSATSLVWGAL